MAANNLCFNDLCTICTDPLRNFAGRGGIVQTPCQHIYHKKCLIDWITAGSPGGRCPLCKRAMTASDATPVRIENAAVADTTRDIPNEEAVLLPLRRSQRLAHREDEVPSTSLNRSDTTSTTNHADMPATTDNGERPRNTPQPEIRVLGEGSVENVSRPQPLRAPPVARSVSSSSTSPSPPASRLASSGLTSPASRSTRSGFSSSGSTSPSSTENFQPNFEINAGRRRQRHGDQDGQDVQQNMGQFYLGTRRDNHNNVAPTHNSRDIGRGNGSFRPTLNTNSRNNMNVRMHDSRVNIPRNINDGNNIFRVNIPRNINDGNNNFRVNIPRNINDGNNNFRVNIPRNINDGNNNFRVNIPGNIIEGNYDSRINIPGNINEGNYNHRNNFVLGNYDQSNYATIPYNPINYATSIYGQNNYGYINCGPSGYQYPATTYPFDNISIINNPINYGQTHFVSANIPPNYQTPFSAGPQLFMHQ